MKQILLCVAGLTPQIITETLYVLTQERHQMIDEIRVITTLKGRNKILESLLSPETGKFWQFCQDFSINPNTIKFNENNIYLLNTPDGRVLSDILSEEDNFLVADQVCQIVSQLTSDPNTTLYASVAGGRKSMGILLTAAMQLFARPQDRLSHVLVTEDFELHPDFYYIPPKPQILEVKDRYGKTVKEISTTNAKIYLADIPFVRLRAFASSRIDKASNSYNQLVKMAQEDLDLMESANELRLCVKQDTIEIGSRRVKLTPREFFVYLLFAQLRQKRQKQFVLLQDITEMEIENTLKIIADSKQHTYNLVELYFPPKYDFIENLLNTHALVTGKKKSTNKDNLYLKKDLSDSWLQPISRIKRKFIKAGIPEKFFILSNDSKQDPLYGLDTRVTPEQIKII
jgi:CRISPR-associated protein (TIGR02584 family)